MTGDVVKRPNIIDTGQLSRIPEVNPKLFSNRGKYFNKCLPINKQKPQICPHDNLEDQHSHFVLDCSLSPILLQHSNQVWREINNSTTEFTAKNVLLLKCNGEVDTVYGTISLWILWKAHNDWTHNNLTIPTYQ